MKKTVFFTFLLFTSFLILENFAQARAILPKLGSRYIVDGQKTKVVGVGKKPFTYISSGESLILINLDNTPCKIVIVPDQGIKVKVDPTKPSLLVGNKEKLDRSLWKIGTYLLVEYDRAAN